MRTKLRVYYVGASPDGRSPILKELWSNDDGKTWSFGRLGDPKTISNYTVYNGSGINAVVMTVDDKPQLHVYFSKKEEKRLSIAYMPLTGNPNAGDWLIAQAVGPEIIF